MLMTIPFINIQIFQMKTMKRIKRFQTNVAQEDVSGRIEVRQEMEEYIDGFDVKMNNHKNKYQRDLKMKLKKTFLNEILKYCILFNITHKQ